MTYAIPNQMNGIQLIAHGGTDQLLLKTAINVPTLHADEVLIKVAAAGINNTDVNTRIGWYSKKVTSQTNSGGKEGFETVDDDDATWSGVPMMFPRIQGADCCGIIVKTGAKIDPSRIGERVLVKPIMRHYCDYRPYECWTFGSECDGAFAQYTKAPAAETYTVNSDWSDSQLASIPCAYSTAENMLHRAKVGSELVLITGASGGVGSAAVQLAKRRGAKVIAIASAAKHQDLITIGADLVVDRNADFIAEIGSNNIDVVIDLVAGNAWPSLLDVLKRGGRYVTAGAIGGPIVELDVRTLYLKDLTLIGCTFQDDEVFPNLISYIEQDEIKPVVAQTFPLTDIVAAQEVFLSKKFTGKLVLIPQHE